MHRPTIAQLEAFYWTAELGSVSKAAERLNVTQPTLSLRLKQLQAGRDVPLLKRLGRGVGPTREGHAFLGHARAVLDAFRQFERLSAEDDLSGTLRIGLAEGFATACLPALLARLEIEHPRLRPEWTIGTSAVLEEALAGGELDAAVLVDPFGLKGLRLHGLGMQRNQWAAAARAGSRPSVRPRDLAGQVVITTPAPTAMYRATIAWFAGDKVAPDRICVCSSLNVAMQLVATGLGVGIFPTRMIEAYPLKGAVWALDCHPRLSDGQVFLADREISDPSRTAVLMRSMEPLLDGLAYFSA